MNPIDKENLRLLALYPCAAEMAGIIKTVLTPDEEDERRRRWPHLYDEQGNLKIERFGTDHGKSAT